MGVSVPRVTFAATRQGVSGGIVGDPYGSDDVSSQFNVTINLIDVGDRICNFLPPVGNSCQADSTFEAVFVNNTLDPGSAQYAWEVVSGAATIIGPADEQTAVVRTEGSTPSVIYMVKVTVILSVLPDVESDSDTQLQVHYHQDASAPPVFIGPDINDYNIPVNVPITPVNYAGRFTGDNVIYSVDTSVNTLPTGLVLSPEGMLTGTPTVVQIKSGLKIMGDNINGHATTDVFQIGVTP